MMKKIAIALVLCFSVAALAQSTGSYTFDGKSWWEYVKVIADDNMEGRLTGSEGEKRAQAYIVEQIKKDGLRPAGANGFYQQVKLVESKVDEAHSSFALVRDGKAETLVLGDELALSARLDGGSRRGTARVRGIRAQYSGEELQRPDGRPEGQGRRDLRWISLRYADRVGLALSIPGGTLEGDEGCRSGGGDFDSQPRGDGHPMDTYQGQSRAAFHAHCRFGRDGRREVGRVFQPGLGTKAVRRIGTHLRRNRRAGCQALSPCRIFP